MRSLEPEFSCDSEVHVWRVDLTHGSGDGSPDLMVPDERQRASEFRCVDAHRTYVKTRTALRMILSGYLGITAREIQFDYSAYGKPELSRNKQTLSFNVSHSGDRALIAVSRTAVGIDLECIRRKQNWRELADVVCGSAESSTWLNSPAEQARHAFYAHWTAKEAYLKARGVGMSLPLHAVRIRWTGGVPSLDVDAVFSDARPWFLQQLDVPLPYVAMLATPCAGTRVKFFSFFPLHEDTAPVGKQNRPPVSGYLSSHLDMHDADFFTRH
jgi:4'-phosphopantetheinyl transferase